jgi:hypothetical protein
MLEFNDNKESRIMGKTERNTTHACYFRNPKTYNTYQMENKGIEELNSVGIKSKNRQYKCSRSTHTLPSAYEDIPIAAYKQQAWQWRKKLSSTRGQAYKE